MVNMYMHTGRAIQGAVVLVVSAAVGCGLGIAVYLRNDIKRRTASCVQHEQKTKKKEKNDNDSFDFMSFLIDPDVDLQVVKKSTSHCDSEDLGMDAAPMVLCLYGTSTGFSREIAETMKRKIVDKMISIDINPSGLVWVQNVEEFSLGIDWIHLVPFLIIAISTQGDGVPPPDAEHFVTWLKEHDFQSTLSNVHYTVAAPGDKSYPHFCAAGKLVDQILSGKNAIRAIERVDIDRENMLQVECWMENVLQFLFKEDFMRECLELRKKNEEDFKQIMSDSLNSATTNSKKMRRRCTRDNPQPAKILSKTNLCQDHSSNAVAGDCEPLNSSKHEYPKRTYCIKVTTQVSDSYSQPLEYEPGDSLGIYAFNHDHEVDILIKSLHLPVANVLIPQPSTWHITERVVSSMGLKFEHAVPDGMVTLRDALRYSYDIRTPRIGLLQSLREALVVCCKLQNTENSKSQEKLDLLNLLLKDGLDMNNNRLLEQFLDHRNVIDIIQAFSCDFYLRHFSTTQTLHSQQSNGQICDLVDSFIAHLRPLLPRLYSISSSPLEDNKCMPDETGSSFCQITVAVKTCTQYFMIDIFWEKHIQLDPSLFIFSLLILILVVLCLDVINSQNQ